MFPVRRRPTREIVPKYQFGAIQKVFVNNLILITTSDVCTEISL